MDFYYAEGDAQRGPVPATQLRALGVGPETLVWHEGMASWQRADAVPELRGLFVDAGAPQAAVQPPYSAPQTQPQYAAPQPQPQYAPSQPQYAPPQPAYQAPYQQPAYAPQQAAPMAPVAYGGYAPTSNPQTASGLAVASMVLGILSIPMSCVYGTGFVTAILAVIFGHMSRGKVRRGEAGGDGMALAGLICGYIALAFALAFIVLIICGVALAGMSH